jgi:3D (Asp-Asp-Asp) domain-containing protein
LAALAVLLSSVPALAADAPDPLGELMAKVAAGVEPILNSFGLKATLYHSGNGIRSFDSMGCRVIPMRTAAVDGVKVPRGSILYIKETVGLPMPDGTKHDGYWFASDRGSAIRAGRIDLFTGVGAKSMATLLHLNLATLTVSKVGTFKGCPKQ